MGATIITNGSKVNTGPLSGINPTFGGVGQMSGDGATSTESLVETRYLAGVFGRARTKCVTNTSDGATTLMFRLNGADSALTMVIGAGLTGYFEDLAHTVTVADEDLVAWKITAAGTTGALDFQYPQCGFTATADTFMRFGPSPQSVVPPSGQSVYSCPWAVGIGSGSGTDTESKAQAKLRNAATFSRMKATIGLNFSSSTTTWKFRKNGADGNQVISVPATTTGTFEDTTHSDVCAADDLVNTVMAGQNSLITFLRCAMDYTTTSTDFHLCGGATGGGSQHDSPPGTYYTSFGTSELAALAGDIQEKSLFLKTLSKFQVVVVTATSASSTMTWRINNVDTPLALTFPTSTTGFFEDLTNSLAMNDGDIVDARLDAGGSGGDVFTLGGWCFLAAPQVGKRFFLVPS
jgi:hypothetical protein